MLLAPCSGFRPEKPSVRTSVGSARHKRCPDRRRFEQGRDGSRSYGPGNAQPPGTPCEDFISYRESVRPSCAGRVPVCETVSGSTDARLVLSFEIRTARFRTGFSGNGPSRPKRTKQKRGPDRNFANRAEKPRYRRQISLKSQNAQTSGVRQGSNGFEKSNISPSVSRNSAESGSR